MKKIKIGILPRIIIAILAGVGCGMFFPEWATRLFITFNALFSNFLGFIIPLLIFGLVAPGIAELGKGAGRLLVLTVVLAYAFTLFSGFMTFGISSSFLGDMLEGATIPELAETDELTPWFTVAMPAVMSVMSALILAFVVGLGVAHFSLPGLKRGIDEFRRIIISIIRGIIIPLLPIYIFGIFL